MISTFLKEKKQAIFLIVFSLFSVFLPMKSFAAPGTSGTPGTTQDTLYDISMETTLCNAYALFNGPIGKAFAIFAIVALGVMFFLGKVNWGTAIAIALGIGAIFGAPTLVGFLTGSQDSKCDSEA